MPEKLLTVQEVAALLGTTKHAVINYVNAGYFPNAWKTSPGKTSPWRIPEKDVTEYLQKLKVTVK